MFQSLGRHARKGRSRNCCAQLFAWVAAADIAALCHCTFLKRGPAVENPWLPRCAPGNDRTLVELAFQTSK